MNIPNTEMSNDSVEEQHKTEMRIIDEWKTA